MPSATVRALSRLSKEKLVELCIKWAQSSKCDPYLARNRHIVETEEEDYLHEIARDRKELVAIYSQCSHNTSPLGRLSKRDIIDRIVDGDWRRGLTYEQLADVDFACLEENDSALRWSALKLVPLEKDANELDGRSPKRRKIEYSANRNGLARYPDITVPIFVQNLKNHISPLVKAQYCTRRLAELKLSVVRLYIIRHTPFAPLNANVPRQKRVATDSARTVFIALADSCPYVYVSVAGAKNSQRHSKDVSIKPAASADIAVLKRVVLEAIPKALSRPQMKWSLESTRLTAKSLRAMTLLCGSGKVGATGGAFSRFVDSVSREPIVLDSDDEQQMDAAVESGQDERQRIVEQRFGTLRGTTYAKLDRVQIRIGDLIGCSGHKNKKRRLVEDHEPAPMTITMSGTNIFGALKQLAMKYPDFVDLDKLPSALTGERNITTMSI